MQFRSRSHRLVEKVLRTGTRRRHYYDLVFRVIRVILNEGWGGVCFKAKVKLNQKIAFWRTDPYQFWIARNEPRQKELDRYRQESLSFQYRPKITIITPVWDTDTEWLESAIDSVLNQVYDNWELCLVDGASKKLYLKQILRACQQKDARIRVVFLDEKQGIPSVSNDTLSLATGEFVGFLGHADELRPDALYEVVKLLNQDRNLDLIYSDEDKIDAKGKRIEAFFKPDWSPDLLMSTNYICHFTVIRKGLVDRLGGFRTGFEGSQDYDLILRVTENTGRIGHISKPLYSWRQIPGSAAASTNAKPYAYQSSIKALQESLARRDIIGEVVQESYQMYRVRYQIPGKPLVSIIIPTKNGRNKLERCIASIESKTTYRNYEIIIIDHDSQESKTVDYLKKLHHKIVKYSGQFNFSKMNNLGVREAKGEHIVFLNDDTEVISPEWLEAMLEHSCRAEVGMVGALLLYPPGSPSAGKIQHAGVALGIHISGHVYKQLIPAECKGLLALAKVVRNCSAVTAACAMTKKTLFEQLGGFDERLRVGYNDIDLCLRLREKGYLIVYTPFAVLHHEEGGTRGRYSPSEDETNFLARWDDTIVKGDPYYNRNLTLLREDYSIAPRPSSIIPLAVLLEIYYLRPDLQKTYTEAIKGEYQRLIDWAATSGVTLGSSMHFLRPYCAFYTDNASEDIKPLAILLEVFNFRADLQSRFPETWRGYYQRLLAWACEDISDERLLPYNSWYRSVTKPAKKDTI